MAASSSAAAAAELRLPKHDVFISFRGETRKSFISHLCSALSRKQIKAYRDDVSLKQGSEISPELVKAIEESEISIIIFSKNYASSSWCLDELVHILKCKNENRIVLPIFFGIDPSHIRKQEGSYAAAFVGHDERFKPEKVREWRQALTEAAGLSGWDSRNQSESELVEEVVERVRRELDTINSKRSDNLKGLVGISKRLEKIKSFLDSPTVRIIGIWGMGGIRKTTLAEVVFKRFYNDFEGSYFAHSVRENVIKKGLHTLQTEVFSELLGEQNLNIFKSDVEEWLSRKRILLVLDDVDDFEQLRSLAGDRDRFCPGSKIIVTSRDKLKVDEEYKVEVLDSNDACKLFYLNAFGHESCRRGFEEISDKVVDYTKGHPLALKVLGASVFYFLESIKDWEKELEKLKRIPNDQIRKVLERSYDALDAEEKGLFLDIACFLKDEKRDFVEGILEGKPIRGLVHKSLITIEDDWICMHDLIQEMGRDIVFQSTDNLGERSRLWIAQDVSYVLENNKGTEAIEGIYLPTTKEEVHLKPDVFEEMSKLRLLKIPPYNAYIDGDLKYLPNSLRYLHWEYHPGKSLPSNFKPQNLVELDMPNSRLEQLWVGVQKLGSLKHINLHSCEHLITIPNLSLAPKLESINLSCCRSLIHIPSLNLQATLDDKSPCWSRQWHQRTPGCIILSGCESLTTLPKVGGNIRILVLSGTALKELPSSIDSLKNLLILDLAYSYNLKRLPEFPRNIEVLLLDSSGIEQIPLSSIEGLCSLRILSLRYCHGIESLPSNINLKALEELNLKGTSIHELPSTIGMLYNLKKLDISNCKNLQSLPASIGMLYKLKWLNINDCENLRSLPELPLFIESVKAKDCSSLEMVSTLRSTLTLGRWLDNYDCDNFRRKFSFLHCTATTPQQVVVSKKVIGELVVCYPSTEIPRWFNNRSEGSSITIILPPNWYNPKTFLGFVVSVVVADEYFEKKKDEYFEKKKEEKKEEKKKDEYFEKKKEEKKEEKKKDEYFEKKKEEKKKDEYFEKKNGKVYSKVGCEVHFMTNKERFRADDEYGYIVKSPLDHIVMWYNYFDHSKANFEKYQEASFEFKSHSVKVKRCGVRMLYLKDAVEESDDVSTVNSESWRTDVIDSDISDDDFQS